MMLSQEDKDSSRPKLGGPPKQFTRFECQVSFSSLLHHKMPIQYAQLALEGQEQTMQSMLNIDIDYRLK